MASRTSTPRSRSRSRSSTSSGSSDTTMLDAPPLGPAQPRRASQGHPSHTQASSKDPTFSLLLSLPRELRDRIYTYALTAHYPFWWPNPASIRYNVAVDLLRTSRQVYEEAAPILYSSNKFLFNHPSDCNIFRIISSPKYSELITSVYFRVRDKDLRLWTTYLGSKLPERSLKSDLPKLKSLWILLRCGSIGAPGMMGHFPGQAMLGLPPQLAAQVQAVQNALGQQVQALQQQVQTLTHTVAAAVAPNPVPGQQPGPQQMTAPAQFPGGGNNANGNLQGGGNQAPIQNGPPPFQAQIFPINQGAFGPPHQHQHPHHHHHPPPGQPHVHGIQNNPPNPSPIALAVQANPGPPPQLHPHQHAHAPHPNTFYTQFLRWERELGLESLCLSLQETRPCDADVKIVCIMRLPKPEVVRLCRIYPEELSVDRNGDARTRFRKLHGVEVSLEVSGFEVAGPTA